MKNQIKKSVKMSDELDDFKDTSDLITRIPEKYQYDVFLNYFIYNNEWILDHIFIEDCVKILNKTNMKQIYNLFQRIIKSFISFEDNLDVQLYKKDFNDDNGDFFKFTLYYKYGVDKNSEIFKREYDYIKLLITSFNENIIEFKDEQIQSMGSIGMMVAIEQKSKSKCLIL